MDNIQKAMLGVLAVAGSIALIVPAESPVAPSPVAQLPSDTPAEPQELPATETPALDSEPLPTDSSDFQIGEPSIDGRPVESDFGMPFGSTENNSSADENAGESNSTTSGYVPPSPSEIPGMPAQKGNADEVTSADK